MSHCATFMLLNKFTESHHTDKHKLSMNGTTHLNKY